MNLKYNIKSVSPTATMPYQPTKLELWISESKIQVPDNVEEGAEQTFTDYVEVQSETTETLHNGICKVIRHFKLPAAALQAMVTGYEIGGKAIINLPMLNGYLQSAHEIELV